MKNKLCIKILSVLMAVILATAPFLLNISASAGEPLSNSSTEEEQNVTEPVTLTEEEKRQKVQQELEAQKNALEEDLKKSEEELKRLAEQSKNTEEYINALDVKIGVLNNQLTILDNQVIALEEDIDALQKSIDKNQEDADMLQKDVDRVQAILDDLNERFIAKYDAYCLRMRAIYISGSFNLLTALLTSSDISSLLTRYEMIKAVSKSDAELLEAIEAETKKILQQESDLNEKKAALDEIKMKLLSEQNQLKAKQESLTGTQNSIAEKKVILAQDRAESDALFARLTAENGMFTEFRNEDYALKEQVENEINGLINGIITADEATTATTSNRDDYSTTEFRDTDLYSNSDGVYNMTYPVPNHYTLSAGFPNYSNGSYHGGIDFPCPTGSSVVAAQKGVVLSVKRLDYSYGYYIIVYHGTDSNGKKVVTLYAHNSSILVSPGQGVSKGQQIAKSGSTGNSTGPHCHFEIRVDNTRVNPKNYLSK